MMYLKIYVKSDNLRMFYIDAIKKHGKTIQTSMHKNINEIAIKNQNSELIGLGIITNNCIHVKRLINFDE